MISIINFRKVIWNYYRTQGRDLPWRRTRDPYRILVSEIMLQQTQVSRVTQYYEKFIKKFSDFETLARAKTETVLRIWQGLGYNRRALSLRILAGEVVAQYHGKLPRDIATLISLPGVGEYTAGAIRAFAFNKPEIFIETNIRRVFIHFFFPEKKHLAGREVTDTEIKRYIERTLDLKNPREWYFALMDYGAMLGIASRDKNPNRRSAGYVRQSRFAGSDRELRGKILRLLLARRKIASSILSREFNEPSTRVLKIITLLEREGFLVKDEGFLRLAS